MLLPLKNRSKLVIDSYTVKALQIPFQTLQPIVRRNSEISQFMRSIEHIQLAPGDTPQRLRQSQDFLGANPVKKILSCWVFKT